MKNISSPLLITGAAGFIGANLVHHFSKKVDVHIIVREKTSLWRLQTIKKNLYIHRVDLLDKVKLQRLIKTIKPKTIFHCASYGNYSYQLDEEIMLQTNIIGTYNLLQACSRVGFSCFVNTGTSSEYGYKKQPMKEVNRLDPVSFYAASKSAATLVGQVFNRVYQLPVVTIRLFSVYGPFEESTRFIPTIIGNILTNSPIKLTPQQASRDFIYIEDVLQVYEMLIQQISKFAGEIVNVGTGKQYTNNKVIQVLFKIMNKRVPIKKGKYPNRSWDTSYWVANISKAASLGWAPTFSLEAGLKKTVEWYKNQSVYDQKR